MKNLRMLEPIACSKSIKPAYTLARVCPPGARARLPPPPPLATLCTFTWMASTFTVLLLDGWATRRTLKFAFENSDGVHVRPHLSEEPPSVTTASKVVSVGDVRIVGIVAVVEIPPFHESSTSIVPAAVEPESSSFTLMPVIRLVLGMENPKPP